MLKELLDKYFPRKFKVRIRHWGVLNSEYYCVEYSNGRFFNVWTLVRVWLTDSSGWNPLLRPYQAAKETAQTFLSVEDIDRWHTEEAKLSVDYHKRVLEIEEQHKKAVPVEIEMILGA